MTTKQAMKKIKEIVKGPVLKDLYNRCEYLLNSGGIDKENYNKDNYLLPKIILSAALSHTKDYWYSLDKENQKKVKNLEVL